MIPTKRKPLGQLQPGDFFCMTNEGLPDSFFLVEDVAIAADNFVKLGLLSRTGRRFTHSAGRGDYLAAAAELSCGKPWEPSASSR